MRNTDIKFHESLEYLELRAVRDKAKGIRDKVIAEAVGNILPNQQIHQFIKKAQEE